MGFDSEGHWHDERERGFPETARSLFDPVVRLNNREQALVTCRIFDAICREKRKNNPPPTIRTEDC